MADGIGDQREHAVRLVPHPLSALDDEQFVKTATFWIEQARKLGWVEKERAVEIEAERRGKPALYEQAWVMAGCP